MYAARIVAFAGRGNGGAMRLRDQHQLAGFLAANAMSQAELARVAGVSRQFIHMLVRGDKRSCRPDVAARIEEALRVLPGTLFVQWPSTAAGRSGPGASGTAGSPSR